MEQIFDFQVVNEEQKSRMGELQDAYKKLMIRITSNVPPGRFRSLAIDALKQSSMWANMGISSAGKDLDRY